MGITEQEQGRLLSDVSYVKDTVTTLFKKFDNYIAIQDARQINRDKECSIHTRDIALLQSEVDEHDSKIAELKKKDIELQQQVESYRMSTIKWIVSSVTIAVAIIVIANILKG